MTKQEFVENQVLTDSINAAFQRANVYADSKAYTDKNRQKLRGALAVLLRKQAKQYYAAPVSEAQHNANICTIAADLTTAFVGANLLRNDTFRIGIAQKAFNLYLKYLWCLGWIKDPPHCPFDFGIIAKLPLTAQQRQALQWTELDSIGDYQALVDAAKKVADDKQLSVAEWELAEWHP